MKIYIDLFFLFNVIMDFIIILGVSLLLKRRTSYFRIIISSIVGGLSSLLLYTNINIIIIELFFVIVISLISFGNKGIKYMIQNILYIYLLSTLLGGIIYLFNIKVSNNIILSYLIIITISVEVIILYIKENKKMRNIYNNYYKVDICFKDSRVVSLVGFVDTGNNLYDPYKQRPIILISSKYVSDDKYILVPYHGVNNEGLLKCIKPDYIFIENIGYKTNLLLGISDSINVLDGVDVILHKDLMKG